MTTTIATNNNIQMQHLFWIDVAKDTLKAGTTRRLYERLDLLERLINAGVSQHGPQFVIDKTLKQSICDPIVNYIGEFQGTKKMITGQVSSQNDVIKLTRTWWHRNKSLRLGSSLFTIICWCVPHNFIWSQCVSLSSAQKLVLFIDIFRSFMNATIKFPKTKPKPLIIQQCFLCDSVFKSICSSFIKIFGDQSITWDANIKTRIPCVQNGKKIHKYVKQKNRSQSLYNAFAHCLDRLKEKWSIYSAHNVYNVDIEALMSQWNSTIQKSTPKQYSLFFVTSDGSSRDKVSGTPPPPREQPRPMHSSPCRREFLGMGRFGRVFRHNDPIHINARRRSDALDRARRQEQHMRQMRQMHAMQDNTRTCALNQFENGLDGIDGFDAFLPLDGCETENPVTYDVI
eukprot:188211_1